jgi:hypothetical protein
VQLAGQRPPAFLLDFEQPRRKLLELSPGLLDLGIVFLGAALQSLGVSEAEPRDRAGEQQADSQDDEQPPRGLPAGCGELPLALLKTLLVRRLQGEQRAIEVEPPRHDLPLKELVLSLVGCLHHRRRQRREHSAELFHTSADIREHSAIGRHPRELI